MNGGVDPGWAVEEEARTGYLRPWFYGKETKLIRVSTETEETGEKKVFSGLRRPPLTFIFYFYFKIVLFNFLKLLTKKKIP